MNERLFLALPVGDNLAAAALAWQAKHPDWPVRWLPASAFHLTLVAPWSDDNPDQVIDRLEGFVKSDKAVEIFQRPIEVEFTKITFGPNRFSPRLIWAEGRAPVALLELKNRLEQAVARPDHRYYRLHLTLARFKIEEFLAAKSLEALPELAEPVAWREGISRFALYRSIFGPEGVDYHKLKEFDFIS